MRVILLLGKKFAGKRTLLSDVTRRAHLQQRTILESSYISITEYKYGDDLLFRMIRGAFFRITPPAVQLLSEGMPEVIYVVSAGSWFGPTPEHQKYSWVDPDSEKELYSEYSAAGILPPQEKTIFVESKIDICIPGEDSYLPDERWKQRVKYNKGNWAAVSELKRRLRLSDTDEDM